MIATQKHFHRIKIEGEEVGYIQILSYNNSHPQIEYDLDEKHWNKGIMTRELGQYLEAIKNDYKVITAVVKKDNLASMRVLEKIGFNDFFLFKKNGYKIYIKEL